MLSHGRTAERHDGLDHFWMLLRTEAGNHPTKRHTHELESGDFRRPDDAPYIREVVIDFERLVTVRVPVATEIHDDPAAPLEKWNDFAPYA